MNNASESNRRHMHRRNVPGPRYLTFSCYHRQQFLARDRTRLWVIETIERARQRHAFALLAYVIMPEHVHLIVLPEAPYDAESVSQKI